MQDYGLGLLVGLKDLPTLRTRIHRQILTELKTFLFYYSTFLTGGRDASRARLRNVCFLALCSSSVRKTMCAKANAAAAWDWKDPEAAHRLQVPTRSAHPPKYPHRRPTTLICCPLVDLRPHGREKLGGSRKSSCRRRHTRRTRRLLRNTGGPTRIVCGRKHFDLVVRFTSFSSKMRACPCILLFFVLQKRMRLPLTGPSRGISIGMTALLNNNATNFNTKRNEKEKEKKLKKE